MGSYLLIFQILVEPIFLSPYFCFVLLLLLFKLKKYLFLATLGPHCCSWAFSSCSEQGLLFVEVTSLVGVASLVAEYRL